MKHTPLGKHVIESLQQAGQGLVEYALILVLVAVVVIAILATLGPQVGNVFSNVVSHLNGANTCTATTNAQAQNFCGIKCVIPPGPTVDEDCYSACMTSCGY